MVELQRGLLNITKEAEEARDILRRLPRNKASKALRAAGYIRPEKSLLRDVGTVAGAIGVMGAVGGIIGAGHAAHRMVSPGKQRHTPILDSVFEATMGIQQPDRLILGTDVRFTDLLPLPHFLRDPFRNFELINQRTFGQVSGDDTSLRAGQDYDAFTQRMAQQYENQKDNTGAYGPGYDLTAGNNNLNATGDMVFGMYNSRQGH